MKARILFTLLVVLALLVVFEGPTTLKLLAGIGAQDQAWQLTGNSQTDPSTHFVGTIDTQPLIIKTSGIEAIHITPGFTQPSPADGFAIGGNVGIGTTNPATKLHITARNQLGLQVQGPRTGVGAGMQLQTSGPSGRGWEILATGATSAQGEGKLNIRDLGDASDDFTITSGGHVGIGTTSPGAKVEVQGSDDPLLLIDHSGASGNPALWFQQDGVTKAYVWWDQANSRLNLGTPTTNPIVSFQPDGTTIAKVLQITGGADVSEHFEVGGAADVGNGVPPIQPGLVVSIDPDHPGKLVVSSHAYDQKVAGIISGAGGVKPGMLMSQSGSVADGEHPVALTGRVYCWADASYDPVKPGDLLTTSDTPGHAMKVINYAKAQGAIIGKAMAELQHGQGLVLVLVTLQ